MAPSYTIIPADAGTDIIATVVATLGANMAPILVLVGFGIALALVRKFVNRGSKGKL